jgi:hypothetical protein
VLKYSIPLIFTPNVSPVFGKTEMIPINH